MKVWELRELLHRQPGDLDVYLEVEYDADKDRGRCYVKMAPLERGYQSVHGMVSRDNIVCLHGNELDCKKLIDAVFDKPTDRASPYRPRSSKRRTKAHVKG